jgi:2-oxoglutarate dehydrogenase E2 component (dihydrolipoamide succinyltransferase)
MPQMGESIAEGTIVRWIKKIGDPIDKDEPLFEISTDKVDAEIPSPGAGVLLEITVKEGETVPVNSVVARIGAKGEKTADATDAGSSGSASPAISERPAAAAAGADGRQPEASESAAPPAAATLDDLRRTRSSPLVRNIAKQHGIDISTLSGYRHFRTA